MRFFHENASNFLEPRHSYIFFNFDPNDTLTSFVSGHYEQTFRT